MTFKELALPMAAIGVPVIRLQPKSKIPMDPKWQDLATTDVSKILAWDSETPGANCACVAKDDGVLFFETDEPGIIERYEQETGETLPETFAVQSREDRYHFYFTQTPESRACGSISQRQIPFGSLRQNNAYVVSNGSIHPKTGLPYTILNDSPIVPVPTRLIEWLRAQITKTSTASPSATSKEPIPLGQHDVTLTAIAGKLRQDGLEYEEIRAVLIRTCEERCVGYGSDYVQMCEKIAKSVCRYPVGTCGPTVLIGGKLPGQNVASKKNQPNVIVEENTDKIIPEFIDQNSEAAIPPFDPSVINGIYGEIVELITRGTTLAPQFAYVIAKTVVGIKMAGKVRFENLDVEPRFYTALIGETGSGKGEAWRRMMQILRPEGQVTSDNPCQIKIINSADSGAGIKDAFFEPPDNLPILCYVDEVEGLGNKSKDTRNPGILDSIIELADSTSVSRVLSKRNNGGGTKTKHDARFAMVMCGQDGNIYMKAFAGRTKLGLWDRFYPEFGTAQETGDLPPVSVDDAVKLFTKITLLNYSGIMTISTEAKDRIESFWKAQTASVRKKARWKKTLTLDAYMSAFGRGSMRVEPDDVAIAIKIFNRQLVIRNVCFTTEVPDRTGYYIGLLKNITENMQRQLDAGIPPSRAAKSRRDYEKMTNAHRDNEAHLFERAWQVHAPNWLQKVTIQKENGQRYEKYLPLPEEGN